jgi:hypothetical protein
MLLDLILDLIYLKVLRRLPKGKYLIILYYIGKYLRRALAEWKLRSYR